MNQICEKCKREIHRGETSVSIIKDSAHVYYHARCYRAELLDKKSDIKTAIPAVK